MRQTQLTAAALLTSAGLWAAGISTSSAYAVSSGFLLSAALIFSVTVALVAMVAGASRWGHRLGLGLSGAMIALGAIVPLSPVTVTAMVLAAVGLVGLNASGVSSMIRQRPAADGPPARAVMLSVAMLTVPILWAVISPTGATAAAIIAVVATWMALIIYARAMPGALLVVRYLLPVTLLGLAFVDGTVTGVTIGLTAVGLAGLAWTDDARIAVHPLSEPGTIVPIPPELAPRDILDAAGIDDRGRRLDDRP